MVDATLQPFSLQCAKAKATPPPQTRRTPKRVEHQRVQNTLPRAICSHPSSLLQPSPRRPSLLACLLTPSLIHPLPPTPPYDAHHPDRIVTRGSRRRTVRHGTSHAPGSSSESGFSRRQVSCSVFGLRRAVVGWVGYVRTNTVCTSIQVVRHTTSRHSDIHPVPKCKGQSPQFHTRMSQRHVSAPAARWRLVGVPRPRRGEGRA